MPQVVHRQGYMCGVGWRRNRRSPMPVERTTTAKVVGKKYKRRDVFSEMFCACSARSSTGRLVQAVQEDAYGWPTMLMRVREVPSRVERGLVSSVRRAFTCSNGRTPALLLGPHGLSSLPQAPHA
jgi:hypothetical protein